MEALPLPSKRESIPELGPKSTKNAKTLLPDQSCMLAVLCGEINAPIGAIPRMQRQASKMSVSKRVEKFEGPLNAAHAATRKRIPKRRRRNVLRTILLSSRVSTRKTVQKPHSSNRNAPGHQENGVAATHGSTESGIRCTLLSYARTSQAASLIFHEN